MIVIGRWLLILLSVHALVACTSTDAARSAEKQPAARPISLLAFGDSGYHYDYLEAEDYDTVVSERQFFDKEREEWIEDKRPIDELAYPPTYRLPVNGSTIAASGLAPVSKAMLDFCNRNRCDFAAMLGDNIYPDGATAGRDDRDAGRFRDLFVTPFAPLAQGRPEFRIYSVLGNHDWRTSREGAMAQMEFLRTTAPFYMDGAFYRVQPPGAHGDVEIFALDTEVLLSAQTVYKAVLAKDGSEQPSTRIEKPIPWAVPATELERTLPEQLEEALRSSKARWKIVIGHHPLWSTAGSKFEQAKVLRRLILPALCRYADVYVAGHEHTLEVHTDDCSKALPGERADPLVEVVSGSASKMRPTNSAFIRHQLEAHRELRTLYAKGLVWGFAHLTFDRGEMRVEIIETPADGTASMRVAFEHRFARRNARGWD